LGSGKPGIRGAAILIHTETGESDIFRSTRDSVEILLGHRARKTNLKESRNILETGSCKKYWPSKEKDYIFLEGSIKVIVGAQKPVQVHRNTHCRIYGKILSGFVECVSLPAENRPSVKDSIFGFHTFPKIGHHSSALLNVYHIYLIKNFINRPG
jgi:hypothetical protein